MKAERFCHIKQVLACAVLMFSLSVLYLPAIAFGANDSAASGGQLSAEQFDFDEQQVELSAAKANYSAALYDSSGRYPGVYKTAVVANTASAASAPVIRIPSIADKALRNAPTTESPAIICGTAVPYQKYENARQFTPPSSKRVAPYSYFKYDITTVKEADGKTPKKGPDGKPLKKLTGFDGTYVIVRIDVSKLFKDFDGKQLKKGSDAAKDYYLHVKQEGNNALLVAIGQTTFSIKNSKGKAVTTGTFTNVRTVNNLTTTEQVGSYNLTQMLDSTGKDKQTPYFDVILFSTASIVSGADANKKGAANGDVNLSFYIDQVADYNPSVKWDPQSKDTKLADKCFKKYYNEAKAKDRAGSNAKKIKVSHYTVKGSELHLETMVKKSGGKNKDTGTTYWSLAKAMQHTYYDRAIDAKASDPKCGRTVKLMSEVAVVSSLTLKGKGADSLRKRTLDVNSFDIQVANNTAKKANTYTSAVTLRNAWLKIADLSKTTGAELAVGNNAKMLISRGGKLIIDKTCQFEVEWDGATTTPTKGQKKTAADVLNNGVLDLRKGGEIVNNGVISIEGTEGKPYQPGTKNTATSSKKGYGELVVQKGAKLTNNGCIMANGALHVLGKLVNNGKYNDRPIVSNDPDKGTFTYHRGIQCSWKDDVTQENIMFGTAFVGIDKDWSIANDNAQLVNRGDIVLCPGDLVNAGIIKNLAGAHIYSCATDKAIIPIEPATPTSNIVTKTVTFKEPKASTIWNLDGAKIVNKGEIRPAQVVVDKNGTLGKLRVPGKFSDQFGLLGSGKVSGKGYLYKHNLKRAKLTVEKTIYNGEVQTPAMIAIIGVRHYAIDFDFTVKYRNAKGVAIKPLDVRNAGKYQAVIKGKNLFKGTATCTFTIAKANVAKAKFSQVKAQKLEAKGKAVKPAITVKYAGKKLRQGTDYTLTYRNNTTVGTGKIIVKGKGNFSGKKVISFEIR